MVVEIVRLSNKQCYLKLACEFMYKFTGYFEITLFVPCILVSKFSMIQADLQEKLLTDESMLEAVLLEVLRLYPPFIGGRRVISQVIVFMVFSLYSEIFF